MELMIVISILAIITTAGFGAYRLTQRSARDSRRRTDLEKVRQALELYRTDEGHYPNEGGGGWIQISSFPNDNNPNLENALVVGGYVKDLPKDPSINSRTHVEYQKEESWHV